MLGLKRIQWKRVMLVLLLSGLGIGLSARSAVGQERVTEGEVVPKTGWIFSDEEMVTVQQGLFDRTRLERENLLMERHIGFLSTEIIQIEGWRDRAEELLAEWKKNQSNTWDHLRTALPFGIAMFAVGLVIGMN